MLSAINVALPASAEKDDDNKVHFVAAFATSTGAAKTFRKQAIVNAKMQAPLEGLYPRSLGILTEVR